MREAWYVLEDGKLADPAEVTFDGEKLVHSSGVAVALRDAAPLVPVTRNVDPEEERAKVPSAPAKRAYTRRDMKAAD